MNEMTYFFALTTLLCGILSAVAIWAPRHLFVKVGALAVSLVFLPLAYATLSTLLSQPKPISLEWWHRHAEEATVLASVMREGQGIDVWLQLPGEAVPGAYTLPWSTALAEQLQRAERDAEGQEGDVRLRMPFERSWDDREPKAYAPPQPALPPKDMAEPPPMEYQRPGEEA